MEKKNEIFIDASPLFLSMECKASGEEIIENAQCLERIRNIGRRRFDGWQQMADKNSQSHNHLSAEM